MYNGEEICGGFAYYDADEVDAAIAELKAEADKVIAELKYKLQNVSEILNETREWLVESQKLHKRCADNAVKVIAELQAQKAQAEDDVAFWKSKYKECKRELDLLKDTNAFYNGGKE
jgi:regulator of replication initiation timing